MTWLFNALRGINQNPLLVSFLRGLLESMAFLVLYAVGDAVATLPNIDPMWVMIAGTGIRFGEGIFDKIDPAKQRQRDAIRKDPNAPSTG